MISVPNVFWVDKSKWITQKFLFYMENFFFFILLFTNFQYLATFIFCPGICSVFSINWMSVSLWNIRQKPATESINISLFFSQFLSLSVKSSPFLITFLIYSQHKSYQQNHKESFFTFPSVKYITDQKPFWFFRH